MNRIRGRLCPLEADDPDRDRPPNAIRSPPYGEDDDEHEYEHEDHRTGDG